MKNCEPLSQLEYDVMLNNFHEYMVIGGMPAIVRTFIENKNYSGILSMQEQILLDYKEDITKLQSTTKYTSLIFTYTYLKAIFNHKIAILLIITNILSNIIIILLIKPKTLENTPLKQNKLSTTISNSIKTNINTLITILGTIIFFNTLPIHLINNNLIKTTILSILEITTSLENLSTINLPINLKLLFTTISISTCGICIETQIKSIINDTYINNRKYLLYRLLHLTIYLMLNYITINIIL